ncbi:hypothetical protein CJP74_00015 [Psittacicella melopsittaci]|uniref:Uncharacterized protein n=1 Tax=Psittacicella melopsittaci TaxID=2028576 RepID=A0A3A1YAJ0_9GAMM|nr:hypothetical protein [Psittacicella melopsittaci]RIY34208.1 hypothetical protein CJP74_00015 [Psittacicella melopsittaci]
MKHLRIFFLLILLSTKALAHPGNLYYLWASQPQEFVLVNSPLLLSVEQERQLLAEYYQQRQVELTLLSQLEPKIAKQTQLWQSWVQEQDPQAQHFALYKIFSWYYFNWQLQAQVLDKHPSPSQELASLPPVLEQTWLITHLPSYFEASMRSLALDDLIRTWYLLWASAYLDEQPELVRLTSLGLIEQALRQAVLEKACQHVHLSWQGKVEREQIALVQEIQSQAQALGCKFELVAEASPAWGRLDKLQVQLGQAQQSYNPQFYKRSLGMRSYQGQMQVFYTQALEIILLDFLYNQGLLGASQVKILLGQGQKVDLLALSAELEEVK